MTLDEKHARRMAASGRGAPQAGPRRRPIAGRPPRCFMAGLVVLALAASAPAQVRQSPAYNADAVSAVRPTLDPVHPLQPWAAYAASRYAYVRRNLRDYSCLLIKRERLNGQLTPYQYLSTRVLLEQQGGSEPDAPLSVFVEYLSPEELKGRKVLYVAGQNEDKMLVRVGGERFSYLKLKVDVDSEAAKRESNYSLTDTALDTIIARLYEQAQRDIAIDPLGGNTRVSFFRNAHVNGRPCRRIRVEHPNPQQGFVFHIAEVYLDDQLELPIRVEGYGWPEPEGQGSPPLLEEFTFTRLRVNQGLTSDDFTPDLLN